MLPPQDTAYVAEGASRTISQYALQTVVPALIAVFTAECQNAENALYSLIAGVQLSAQPLGGGNWDVLDKLGALVGQPRNGLGDSDYLAQIKIKIRVNRSSGQPEDIIQITALLLAGGVYLEYPTAGYEEYIGLQSNSVVSALLGFLGTATGGGISGYVRYSAGANVLTLSDHVSGTLGTGFPDFISGQFPNAPVSFAQVISS